MSVGGVLGGIFNAIVAPLVFTAVIEYPLVLAASCLLRPAMGPSRSALRAWLLDLVLPAVLAAALVGAIRLGNALLGRELALWEGGALLALAAMAALSFIGRPLRFALAAGALMLTGTLLVNQSTWTPWGLLQESGVLHGERSFFGVIRVREYISDQGNGRKRIEHTLVHGSTNHGAQWAELAQDTPDPRERWARAKKGRTPITYYFKTGPVGQVFTKLTYPERTKEVGVIGLGTGTTAAWMQPHQHLTYFEIDPAVVKI
jgi:hypothetical protein